VCATKPYGSNISSAVGESTEFTPCGGMIASVAFSAFFQSVQFPEG